jgi:hypothetical protein
MHRTDSVAAQLSPRPKVCRQLGVIQLMVVPKKMPAIR